MSQRDDRHFVGLDLGPPQEFTALAVLERPQVSLHDPPQRRRPAYALRHLQRFAPGTPFPEVFAAVVQLLQTPLLSGSELVVDQTGVGHAVVRLLLDTVHGRVNARIWPVTLTAGHEACCGEQGGLLVPKKELVGTVQVLLQSRRLAIARSLPDAVVLLKELEDFRAKVMLAKTEVELDWRDKPHDDLVLALALASWIGELALPGLDQRFEETTLQVLRV